MNEIVVIVDRSGSMTDIAKDMEGGINQFIEDQQLVSVDDPNCKLTLAQFDTEYDLVWDGAALSEVGNFSLVPRGATALLDAVGKTVSTVHERRNLKMGNVDAKMTGKVIVLVITDGYENSSTEWKLDAIKQLVKDRTADGWDFIYLGANVDAFAAGGGMGFQQGQTLNYVPTSGSVAATMNTTSEKVGTARSTGAAVQSFTSEEREDIKPGEGNTEG